MEEETSNRIRELDDRQLSSRLEYFPDDFDQRLIYLELLFFRYDFERKTRRLEVKRRQDGWLNDKVGYESICHDSRGNLIDGLGNSIKEAEGGVEEEEGQERDDEELRLRLTRTGRHTEVAIRLYSINGAYQEPKIYLSLC